LNSRRLGLEDLVSKTWSRRLGLEDLVSKTWSRRLGLEDLVLDALLVVLSRSADQSASCDG
jgi:hypothetical protein